MTNSISITDGTFFLVTVAGQKTIYGTEGDAINHLRTGDVTPETDDVSVVRVTVEGEDWEIKELAWQRIALELLGGED